MAKVLVVDDDQSLRLLYQKELGDDGHQVTTVPSGKDALETISRDGHILKLDLDEGQKRFDGRIDHHYHLRCLACGRVLDINLDPQTEIVKKANRMNNCLVTGHKLEFTGLCARCRKDRGTKG